MKLTTGHNETRIRRAHWCGLQIGRFDIRLGVLAVFKETDFSWSLPFLRLHRRYWHPGEDGILRHVFSIGLDVFALNIARRA